MGDAVLSGFKADERSAGDRIREFPGAVFVFVFYQPDPAEEEPAVVAEEFFKSQFQ